MTTERDSTMTIVEAIIDNLCGRSGFDAAFDVGDDILEDIKQEMADTIDAHLATRDAVVISDDLLHGHLAPTYGEADEDGVGYFFTCEDLEKFVAACAESLASRKVAVPDGYVLVPVEPTDAMCSAPDAVWHPEARKIWKQMIAALQDEVK